MRTIERPATIRGLILIAAVALAVDLHPAPLAAQRRPESPSQGRTGRDEARADTLVAQAEALQRSRGQWLEVARLYRRAATLRGDDSAAVTGFRLAAWAYGAIGDLNLAREMMEKAGEHATRIGDVERAIVCFLDAALIAKANDRLEHAVRLIDRTRTLLASPLLPPETRQSLERRIGLEPTLAGTTPR